MENKKKVSIGGQAVIEGVMILSPTQYSISVRRPNGSIKTKTTRLEKSGSTFTKLPLIRGSVNLWRMLSLGMKALTWSADQSAEKKEEKLTKNEMAFTILFSILFAVGIFLVIPYLLTHWIGFHEEKSPFFFNLVDGIIRIAFFLIYIYAISLMPDIKRMFQYHGAEHMAIHCYEHNKPLTVANVSKFSSLHPRCGTAFLLIVLTISILLFSLIPSIIIALFPNFIALDFWLRKIILFLSRLLLLPLVAGVSYEILKASDAYKKNILFAIVSYPGMMLQKITTQPPTKDQIEVAIASVNAVLKKK